jgi:hypothetical protein
MHPLDKIKSFKLIRENFKKSRKIIVFAPYFGEGACDSLGLSNKRKKVEIYCALLSGGCNPYEVEKIHNAGVKSKYRRQFARQNIFGR